jgi:ABC-type nitrate/sulfonate/bicarbonate transport system substrate-binding protein
MNRFLRNTLLLIVLLTACQPAKPTIVPSVTPVSTATTAPTAAPMKMTFMAGYKPQADLPFVGVYVAQEKGFFAVENLQVAIEHSQGQGAHLQLTASGKVQVTTQDAAVLLQRRADPGLPLVSFALIGQRGQQAYAALESSGIKTPKDWEGRMVGYKGTPPPDMIAMLKQAGADPAKIDLVNVGFDPRLLSEGKVDVYPVFKSNEPFLLQSWGYKLVLWDPADFGVPTLGLAYVTSDDTLKQNPEMLTRFLRASLKGIQYASQNPDEAINIVMKYAGPETDPKLMRYMLDAEMKDLVIDTGHANLPGWQTKAQWQALADMLQQNGAIKPVDVDQVITTKILEAVYGK